MLIQLKFLFCTLNKMQCTMLTNPIDGHVKTGYSYPIKTELCPRGLKKGMGNIFAKVIKMDKEFLRNSRL